MKKVIFYLMIVVIIPPACKKESLEPIRGKQNDPMVVTGLLNTYTIQKGSHYCDQTHFEIIIKPSVSAVVTFDSSAIYTSVAEENQRDVNKLIGFSDCGTDHQENSARLGWSWNGEKLVIYAYAYNNKERITKTLGTAPLDKPFSCSVKAGKGQYYFTLDNVRDSIPRHCGDFTGTHYKLFPYFGGDEVALHAVKIIIDETP